MKIAIKKEKKIKLFVKDVATAVEEPLTMQ